MKKLITLTVALSVASINFATAQDALPLDHGIYVRASVPCKSPGVVDTIAFWGKHFGIGHDSCDFKNVQRNGMTIHAKLNCAPIQSGKPYIVVSTFTLKGRRRVTWTTPDSSEEYRWCAPTSQALWP